MEKKINKEKDNDANLEYINEISDSNSLSNSDLKRQIMKEMVKAKNKAKKEENKERKKEDNVSTLEQESNKSQKDIKSLNIKKSNKKVCKQKTKKKEESSNAQSKEVRKNEEIKTKKDNYVEKEEQNLESKNNLIDKILIDKDLNPIYVFLAKKDSKVSKLYSEIDIKQSEYKIVVYEDINNLEFEQLQIAQNQATTVLEWLYINVIKDTSAMEKMINQKQMQQIYCLSDQIKKRSGEVASSCGDVIRENELEQYSIKKLEQKALKSFNNSNINRKSIDNNSSDLYLLKKYFDYYQYICAKLAHLPKSFREGFVKDVEDYAKKSLELLAGFKFLKDDNAKLDVCDKIDTYNLLQQNFIRIIYEANQIKETTKEHMCQMLEELGRLNRGLKKHYAEKIKDKN